MPKRERKAAPPRQPNGRFLPGRITNASLQTSKSIEIEELIPPTTRWIISTPTPPAEKISTQHVQRVARPDTTPLRLRNNKLLPPTDQRLQAPATTEDTCPQDEDFPNSTLALLPTVASLVRIRENHKAVEARRKTKASGKTTIGPKKTMKVRTWRMWLGRH
jgi:hypothetical protein